MEQCIANFVSAFNKCTHDFLCRCCHQMLSDARYFAEVTYYRPAHSNRMRLRRHLGIKLDTKTADTVNHPDQTVTKYVTHAARVSLPVELNRMRLLLF